MKRLAILMVILALAGCSSKAKPSANGAQSPSANASPGSASSAQRSPSPKPDASGTSAAPSVTASTHSTSKPQVFGGAVVPAPGTYHYAQSGSVQAGPFNFAADPKGTLAIGAPVDDSGAKREQQERAYSSDWSQEQILLFRSTGVYIKSVTSRFGSGGFAQADTCTPSHPLKAIALPLVVGNSWSDSATCGGRTITVSGKVSRTETRTVGGVRVATDVVNIVTHQTGNGYNVTLNLTMWIAPKYGLSVHATAMGSGTAQGQSFKENLTEDLDRLTPDR
jgi:hypothetical protein